MANSHDRACAAGVRFVYYEYDHRPNNIQAAISAVLLAENMLINPKSVNGAISQVQTSEIDCKMVKLKMIDSSDKIELGQTKWRTKMRRRLKLFT